MMLQKTQHIIGIDFDGQYIRLGKIKSAKMQLCTDFKINPDGDQDAILNDMISAIDNLFDDDVAGIGIGVPSVVDVQNGIVYDVARVPAWREVHLKKILMEHFNVPVYVNNDANCFAIGEKYYGKGQQSQNLVGLIIGEGMGAGFVFGGKLRSGPNCGIGEFGRISYKDATYEYYCSIQFFEQVHDIQFEEALYRAEKGDVVAREIFNEYGESIGDALQMIVYALDPELIILGGKISQAYPYFQENVSRKLAKISFSKASKKLKIELSNNPHIGVLGAASLYHDAVQEDNINQLETEKKAAEIALEESKEKYYKLFNQIADPIFIFDKKTYKFLDCNEQVIKRIYGYSKDELQLMTPLDLHPPEELEKVSKRLRIRNKDIPFRYKHVTKTGKKFDVEILSDEINYDGHVASLSIVRDISARVRIEQELKRKATQTTLLYKVGNQLSRQLELDRLLEEIVESIRDSFNYFGVMLFLMDDKSKKLNLKSITGGYKDIFPDDLSVKKGEGMVGTAALKQEIQLSGDVSKNPDYIRKGEENTKSELCAPILSSAGVIGVLDIQSDQSYAFNDDDAEVVATLCSQIASAIDNARLYHQAQQEISERIQAQRLLVKSRDNLRKAKKETDNILENVEEGLFTINRKYHIASQYSRSLCALLEAQELARQNIINVLKGKIPRSILNNAAEYLELMFNAGLDEKDLFDLNPLNQVEFTSMLQERKFLAFNFKRIFHNDRISGLIATVNDITEQIVLSQKLEASQAQSKRQMDWLLNMLHVEPELIQEFIESAERELPGIQEALHTIQMGSIEQELVDTIYRSVHLIKGNASLLDLNYFAETAHCCEERLQDLKRKGSKVNQDVQVLNKLIQTMADSIHEMKGLIAKIGQIHKHFRPKRRFESEKLVKSLIKFIETIGKDYNKQVQLNTDNFDAKALPYQYRLLLKDILVQLVRNSMVHGIEQKNERVKLHKAEQGKIEISSVRKNKHFEFVYEDDGRGLQIDMIRERAAKSNIFQSNDLKKWEDEQIAQLIFEPGITTAQNSDMTAGRGIGMNLIREKLEKYNGSIIVDTKRGKYCRFIISLPHNPNGKNNHS